ncbi:hypothetical protein CYFUS_004468 [Cystobacter fuscus]|uniref:Uncharacterized protein n=1 Tax=Cystobacter fuscus TaxID=43 RepID=A0A250J502_9BACT|nr:hypothetical protein [Cystobacter fuscus]ATB39029.1 hypothetical protein CYFUS_004468 [Cystobacter fuscus]
MLRVTRGALVEYGLSVPPLALVFDFNPSTLSRTRTLTVNTGGTPGLRGGYDFALPTETPRVAQGVTVQPESFTLEILLDATDRMHEGEAVASSLGIQPELDTLRSMIEPKSQGPGGLQLLASLGLGTERAFRRDQFASVLLFVWGGQVLPVFLTSVRVEEKDFLPSLIPYRATASLTLQVIEGNNPFYLREKARQLVGAAVGVGRLSADVLKGVF